MLLILRPINHFAGNGLASHSPPDANDEVNLRLCGYVEVTGCARSPLQANLLLLLVEVLLHVRLRALEDDLALGLGRLHRMPVSKLPRDARITVKTNESVPKDGMFPATQ